jgi:hypothetical protein
MMLLQVESSASHVLVDYVKSEWCVLGGNKEMNHE